MNPADPYNAYYRHKLDKLFQGEMEEETPQAKSRAESVEATAKPTAADIALEPPTPNFILDLPNITAIDL